MDKNRIEGRHGAMRGHNTPKSPGMPVEVNAAVVQRSNVPLPGEICRSRRPSKAVASEAERLERGRQKSAEAIVVEETSRSAQKHGKVAGVTHPTKGRTSRAATNDRRGGTPLWADQAQEIPPRWIRKHVEPQSTPHHWCDGDWLEPPDTDPYVRWCGTPGLIPRGTRLGLLRYLLNSAMDLLDTAT
jgi:hypothetical protein